MIAAVVLAAGFSRRMGENKLHLPLGGMPLYQHGVRLVAKAGFYRRFVVTNDPEIAEFAQIQGLTAVPSPRAAEGMGCSVAAVTAALPPDCTGALFLNGDQPFVTEMMLAALTDTFRATDRIIVPVADGVPTTPCLFPRRFFPELCALTGDRGGRAVYRAHPDETCFLPMPDAAVFQDVDTPEAYRAACARMEKE